MDLSLLVFSSSAPFVTHRTNTSSGGGLATAQNRTKWPVTGGAVSFQPGWFNGHQTAFIYINIGLGTVPLNYSHPMVPVMQLTGPNNNMYPGTFCLPQIPLPANITYNIGDNATIQVIETAVHGAALYSVGFRAQPCNEATNIYPFSVRRYHICRSQRRYTGR
jgi:hypothetical protein